MTSGADPSERTLAAMRKEDTRQELTETDEVLVDRARSADQEAFGALVGRYTPALEGILFSFAADRDHAKDLVQETVLRAWKNLDRYKDGHRFSTWFFRIGVNLAISARRRTQLELRLMEPGTPRGPHERLTPPKTPIEALLLKEDATRLQSALGMLPERYRKILALRYGDGLSCKEIAEMLETTANTISIILFRAKQRLKEDLEES